MSSSMQMIWIRMPAQRQKMQRAMDQVSQSCDNYDLTISTKRQRWWGHCQNCKSQCGIRKTPCKCLDQAWHQAESLKGCGTANPLVCMWDLEILNHFHLSCLRKLLKIKRQDKIPDTKVLKKAGKQSMHTVLKLAQLRWTDHVIRLPNERLPKKVFYGELQEGKRSQGGYKDTLKASLKDFDIPIGSWEQTAHERSKWWGRINKGAALYEKKENLWSWKKAQRAQSQYQWATSWAHGTDLLYLQPTV